MPTTKPIPLLVGCLSVFACGAARAQVDEDPALAAQAITEWANAYAAGRLGPRGPLRGGGGPQLDYVRSASKSGFVGPDDYDRLNHLDVLQKILFFAEKHPSAELAEAVLGIAGAGLDGEFLDPTSVLLRELGVWTLMRMDHRGAWFVVLRTAAGTPRDENSEPPDIARRIAALRLLGLKGEAVFRTTLETSLHDPEPRVRIAAAEALGLQRSPQTLALVLQMLPMERHPVVAQALAQLLMTLLHSNPEAVDMAMREQVVKVALSRFGQAGWRTDMELLDLVEQFPHKAAVPLLIEALAKAAAPPDRLVKAVNAKASPRRKQRVVELLRRMTGALIAPEDLAGWRKFWNDEGPRLVLPETLGKPVEGATRAEFFGVPVTGGSIGFLIDTSGSMEHATAGTAAGGPRSKDLTRLGAAKEQLGIAVQAMDPEATFLLISFAGDSHLWTRTPIKAGTGALRSLTELTSRMKPEGGTNLYAGLAAALHMQEARFGQQTPAEIDELFVLSDGMPTTGEVRDQEGLLEMVRQANKFAKVRIHTVFTGTGDGAELLRRIADENGGVFVQR
ncbi:MAG: HEAT repeat domain-containing protein [Planctomycetes bacterium]|nr:HEAT repeat domain-containing protein [Planctomycetota bacterium]MCB9885617.1 HEAT repeat domain-containing protein [Planctomycetota bacterium]